MRFALESDNHPDYHSVMKTKTPCIEKQNADWDHFFSALQNELDSANTPRRDRIDVIRVALWFLLIKNYLGVPTAYAIEKKVDPKAFRRKEETGDLNHKNLWSTYRIGQHVPRKKIVAQANKQVPQSAVLLNNVLWEAIRGKKPIGKLWSNGLAQFAPEILRVVVALDHLGQTTGEMPAHIKHSQLKRLERQGGIDALTCLTLLLRGAVERGDQSTAFAIAQSLYSVLLVVCTQSPFYYLCNEVFKLFKIYVFSLLRNEHCSFDFDDFNFNQKVEMLIYHYHKLKGSSTVEAKPIDVMRSMYKVINGDHGIYLLIFYTPPLRFPSLESI
ncbi:hypothetical protein HA050_16600 [Iodobacter sp. HSC-16F04]|uniref:Uncharacterized protein n=1 Tax=Iodobacter violaceini TaxID=3044271 RepID=A0ABX0L0C7_9NEIS|nr:hypothetical protein [Iodobacter violacea]NHQ87739.1 hypothetical protein [Iodobacter violacea]